MSQHKLFVVENGSIVYIRDDNGLNVFFNDFAEFNKYVGADLTGKWAINYEPAIDLFYDSEDSNITQDNIPDATYEGYISNIQTYLDRQADPFYGITDIDEAKTIKSKQILDMEDEKSYDPILFEGNYYKPSDAVASTLQACGIEGQAPTDPIYVNGGYWDTIDGTSIAFTVQDLNNLYKTGYDQQAANYTNMKTHISNVMALTTIQDVIDYDFSTGWQ